MNPCPQHLLLTSYLLGDLPPSEAEAVLHHLEACATCRAEAAALATTLETLRNALATDAAQAPAALTPDRRACVLATPPDARRRKAPPRRWMAPFSALTRPDLFRKHRWLTPALATAATLALLLGVVLPGMFGGRAFRGAHAILSMMPEQATVDELGDIPCEEPAPTSRSEAVAYGLADPFGGEDGLGTPEVAAGCEVADASVVGFSAVSGVMNGVLSAGEGVPAAWPAPACPPTPAPPATLPPVATTAPTRPAKPAAGKAAPATALRRRSGGMKGNGDRLATDATPSDPFASGLPASGGRSQRNEDSGRKISSDRALWSEPAGQTAAKAESPSSAPAAFDSVAIVKSPVVLRGVHGSRSSETLGLSFESSLREEAPEAAQGSIQALNGRMRLPAPAPGDVGVAVEALYFGSGNVVEGRSRESNNRAEASRTDDTKRQEFGRDSAKDGADEMKRSKKAEEAQQQKVLAEREAAERQDLRRQQQEELAKAVEDRNTLNKELKILSKKYADLDASGPAFAAAPEPPPPPTEPETHEALSDEDLQKELAQVMDDMQGLKRQYANLEKKHLDLLNGSACMASVGPTSEITGEDVAKPAGEASIWDFGGSAPTKEREEAAEPPASGKSKELSEPTDPSDPVRAPQPPVQPLEYNPIVETAEQPLSTFAIDVDTAAYTLVRQSLENGQLPEPSHVRTEEIVNAFEYGDHAPEHATFRIFVEGAPAPFSPGRDLLRLGIKGRRLGREEQRPAVLTFLVDASGSMAQPDRIGLARQALEELAARLGPDDQIQLLAFNETARVLLAPTPAGQHEELLAAFDRIQPTGPTNLERGMQLAYSQAVDAFRPGAENRVILLSDGVANLGTGEAGDILARIDGARRQGIALSVFGVGRGTYNDAMLERLANQGDGTYRFLDSPEEVRRAFVEDLAATLYNIASDVKIQVEWNPQTVVRYRQLGYENRALTAQQFRDDTVDAGEVGSGQSVTALYEIERNIPQAASTRLEADAPLGTVRVRFRPAEGGPVEEIERPILPSDLVPSVQAARHAFQVAAGAAAFAEKLRQSPYAANVRFDAVAGLLRPAALALSLDTRVAELVRLVEAADALTR